MAMAIKYILRVIVNLLKFDKQKITEWPDNDGKKYYYNYLKNYKTYLTR